MSRFRELLARAHPTGDAPPWLVQLVDHVTQEAAELKAAKAELERIDRDATAQEEHVREVRARIGRALDELVRDESRCNGRLLELAEKLTEARRRLADIDRPLLTAWGAVPVMPAAGPKVTRDVAAALRDAGALASAWVELDRSVSSLERDAGEREREREDLRFQLAQLKGRLGTLHAEADIDGGALRDRARKLDTNVQERSEQLLQRAEQLVAHFERFPHLRALVHELDEAAATRPTVAHQR